MQSSSHDFNKVSTNLRAVPHISVIILCAKFSLITNYSSSNADIILLSHDEQREKQADESMLLTGSNLCYEFDIE